MDALDQHLESLASLGSFESQGAFTLSHDQVWERLSQALPDGMGSLRFLLRWLHSRQAREIAVVEDKSSTLTVSACFDLADSLPDLRQGEDFDFSGADIDLARAAVGAQMLKPMTLHLELNNGLLRHGRTLDKGQSWKEGPPSSGNVSLLATYQIARHQWTVVPSWEQDAKQRFRCSPLDLRWDGTPISTPFTFLAPVLAWRHLRPEKADGAPMIVMPPRSAVESFRAARPGNVDVVLGMLMGSPTGDRREFQLLRHGELLPLPQAERELLGFCAVIRNDDHPLDLEGNKPVWNQSIEALVAGFKDEAVDMAIQLYRRESPLEAGQAESIFLGMQSVLLHLLDHQRFTEGHLLASWLRPQIEDSRVLQDFRNGYTFDKICALLAEPAGQPQTSIRWNKHAEARVREQSGRLPATVDAALLIAARLEMRSRRNQAHQLSGDTRGRLVQLARREEQRQRHLEAAEAFLMLGMSLPPGDAQRLEFLTEAASCGKKAGLPYYAGVLAREKTARNPIGRQ